MERPSNSGAQSTTVKDWCRHDCRLPQFHFVLRVPLVRVTERERQRRRKGPPKKKKRENTTSRTGTEENVVRLDNEDVRNRRTRTTGEEEGQVRCAQQV